MRISDWSSDVCTSSLGGIVVLQDLQLGQFVVDVDAGQILELLVERVVLPLGGVAAALVVGCGFGVIGNHAVGQVEDIDVIDRKTRSEERRGGNECVSTIRTR